jgi:TM2 domain-containing membrane protein YozV
MLSASPDPIDDVISIPAAPPHPGGGATFVPAAQQNVVVNVLQPMQAAQRWSPGVAAVLSFFIPGLGQMYKGQIVNGLAWLIVVIIGYALFIIPGLILHLLCILGAASGNPTK